MTVKAVICTFIPRHVSSSPLLPLTNLPPSSPQIFSLVVFASIINEGYVNIGSERLHCVFNLNADACNYGVFVGLVGLLACTFFFMLDYKFASISSVKDRKKAVMLEIGFSGEQETMDRQGKKRKKQLLLPVFGHFKVR